MPASDYISHGSSGALKLKGSAGVEKKQRKKKKRKEENLKSDGGDDASRSTSDAATRTQIGIGTGNATDSAEQNAKEIASIKEQGSGDGDDNAEMTSNQPSTTLQHHPTDNPKNGNGYAAGGGAATLTPDDVSSVPRGKTEAQLRYEERRRKRLDERLRREGVKTHKERVEELNRYLSNLSEHHDMPRIGPG